MKEDVDRQNIKSMQNKVDKMKLIKEFGTNEIFIGIYKEKHGELLDMECCRRLTQQEIYAYCEMFLKYFLDELSKGDESYLVNMRDNIRYEIKRIKGESK